MSQIYQASVKTFSQSRPVLRKGGESPICPSPCVPSSSLSHLCGLRQGLGTRACLIPKISLAGHFPIAGGKTGPDPICVYLAPPDLRFNPGSSSLLAAPSRSSFRLPVLETGHCSPKNDVRCSPWWSKAVGPETHLVGLQQSGWKQTAYTHASVCSGGSLNGLSGSQVCTSVSFYLLSWRAVAGSEHT